MNNDEVIDFVGGPLNGQESAYPTTWLPSQIFLPRLTEGIRWEDYTDPSSVTVDVYDRLLDTSIYIYKGIE